MYRGIKFDSIKGNTNSWWNKGQPNTSDRDLTLVADLDTDIQSKDWIYGGNSVLGLSPNSEYLRYLTSTYKLTEGNTIFSLFLKLDNIDNRYNSEKNTTYSESFLTLNGYQTDYIFPLDPIIWSKSDSTDNIWAITDSKSKIGSMKEIDSDACIVWNANEYLLVESVDTLLTAINQAICGKNDCQGKGSISKGPNISLKIKDVDGNSNEITVPPTSYIYLDKQKNQFRASASSIQDYYSNGCGSDQKIGFGRQFFLDFYLIFKIDSKGSKSVGIGEILKKPVFTNQELVYIVVGGFAGVMTLIYILRFFYFAYQKNKEKPKKEKDEGKYYNA